MWGDNRIKIKTKEAEYTYMIKKINMLKSWFLEVAPKSDKLHTYANQTYLEMKKDQTAEKDIARE